MTPQHQSENEMDWKQIVVNRLTALENWRQQSEITDARREEQLKAMEERIDARFASVEKAMNTMIEGLDRRFTAIMAHISKVGYTIFGCVMTAGLAIGGAIFLHFVGL